MWAILLFLLPVTMRHMWGISFFTAQHKYCHGNRHYDYAT
jgi:hypothetical protein